MRLAYADPPYLGLAKKFYGDPTYDRIEAHAALIQRLADYDGWALSLHSPALARILPLCPGDVRISAWVKPWFPFRPGVNPAYGWEPVIWRGGRQHGARARGRNERTVKDWCSVNSATRKGLRGAKPEGFAFWLFDLLGADPGDEFFDLFPGSGAVTVAWAKWSAVHLDAPDYAHPITEQEARR